MSLGTSLQLHMLHCDVDSLTKMPPLQDPVPSLHQSLDMPFFQDPVCKIFQWLTLLQMQRTELPPCSNGVLLATETLLQGIFELVKIFLQSPRLCQDEVYGLPHQTSQQPVTFLLLAPSIELRCFLELEYKCIPFTNLP